MINKVILVGRLGNKPSLKEGKTGVKYASFTMVTNSGFGEKRTSDWHDVTCFGKTAENAAQYLDKGNMVFVEGRIQYDIYENKEGKRQKSVKIVADSMRFLTTNGNPNPNTNTDKAEAPSVQQSEPSVASANIPEQDNPFIDAIDFNEIPF